MSTYLRVIEAKEFLGSVVGEPWVDYIEGETIVNCIAKAARQHGGVLASAPRLGDMVIFFADASIGAYEIDPDRANFACIQCEDKGFVPFVGRSDEGHDVPGVKQCVCIRGEEWAQRFRVEED